MFQENIKYKSTSKNSQYLHHTVAIDWLYFWPSHVYIFHKSLFINVEEISREPVVSPLISYTFKIINAQCLLIPCPRLGPHNFHTTPNPLTPKSHLAKKKISSQPITPRSPIRIPISPIASTPVARTPGRPSRRHSDRRLPLYTPSCAAATCCGGGASSRACARGNHPRGPRAFARARCT